MDEMLTPEEVAKILKVTPHTVRNYCRQGVLRGQMVGGVWRISYPLEISSEKLRQTEGAEA